MWNPGKCIFCRNAGVLASQPTTPDLDMSSLLTPNLGIWDPQITPGMPVYHSSSLTFRLMTASEHYLVRTQEVANVFIPLEFSKVGDTKSHWHRTSMSWHNGMCGWSSWLVNMCWLITQSFSRALATLPLQLLQTRS